MNPNWIRIGNVNGYAMVDLSRVRFFQKIDQTMRGCKMKTYKDTVEIERSEEFISWLVIEEFTIGNMQFFVRKYVLEDGNNVFNAFNLFGVFTHHNAFTDSIEKKDSPAFESKTDCLRYAIELYNENYQHRYLNGKNCLGNTTKNGE